MASSNAHKHLIRGPGLGPILASKGESFGELAIINAEPRSATVKTTTTTLFYTIHREELEEVLGKTGMKCFKGHNIQRNILWSELVEIKELGTGTFSKEKLVRHRDRETGTSTMYALKVMPRQGENKQTEVNAAEEEFYSKKVDHPFVLKQICGYADEHNKSLLIEFVPGGELYSIMRRRQGGVGVKSCQFYATCVASALGHLHNEGVIYRDLKPENIMIDETGYPKIVDFGCTKCLMVGEKTYTIAGSLVYCAPEVLSGKGYTHAIDWWAFGR